MPVAISWTSDTWNVISTVHRLKATQDIFSTTPWGRFTDRTTDNPDLIIAEKGTWQANDSIDGGGGVNTIRGFFPGDGAFTPNVKNVQRAEIMFEKGYGAIDFSHWTGLKFLDLDGSLGITTQYDPLSFNNVPLNTILGINDIVGHRVSFNINPLDHATFANQKVELQLINVGSDQAITEIGGLFIQWSAQLQLHVWGSNVIDIHSPASVIIDGSGTLTIKDEAIFYNRQVVDASKTTGSLHYINDKGYPVDITFGSGKDTFETLSFTNLNDTGKIPANLDQFAMAIHGYKLGTDRLSIHNDSILFDGHTKQTMDSFGDLKTAAEYVASQNGHAGVAMVDVFQYKNNTYVFADQNGDHHVSLNDGLIKLVGVGAHGEFLTAIDFGLPLIGH